MRQAALVITEPGWDDHLFKMVAYVETLTSCRRSIISRYVISCKKEYKGLSSAWVVTKSEELTMASSTIRTWRKAMYWKGSREIGWMALSSLQILVSGFPRPSSRRLPEDKYLKQDRSGKAPYSKGQDLNAHYHKLHKHIYAMQLYLYYDLVLWEGFAFLQVKHELFLSVLSGRVCKYPRHPLCNADCR